MPGDGCEPRAVGSTAVLCLALLAPAPGCSQRDQTAKGSMWPRRHKWRGQAERQATQFRKPALLTRLFLPGHLPGCRQRLQSHEDLGAVPGAPETGATGQDLPQLSQHGSAAGNAHGTSLRAWPFARTQAPGPAAPRLALPPAKNKSLAAHPSTAKRLLDVPGWWPCLALHHSLGHEQ